MELSTVLSTTFNGRCLGTLLAGRAREIGQVDPTQAIAAVRNIVPEGQRGDYADAVAAAFRQSEDVLERWIQIVRNWGKSGNFPPPNTAEFMVGQAERAANFFRRHPLRLLPAIAEILKITPPPYPTPMGQALVDGLMALYRAEMAVLGTAHGFAYQTITTISGAKAQETAFFFAGKLMRLETPPLLAAALTDCLNRKGVYSVNPLMQAVGEALQIRRTWAPVFAAGALLAVFAISALSLHFDLDKGALAAI